jgi:hypothetical protein
MEPLNLDHFPTKTIRGGSIITPETEKTFTVTDPREFDGDPYQVAERAVKQLRGIFAVADHNLTAVDLMVRNAELERLLATGVDGDELREKANGWPESPQGRKLAAIQQDVVKALDALASLEKAAAYNPKARSSR